MAKMVKTLNNMLMAETRRANARLEILSTKKDTVNESSESKSGARAPLTVSQVVVTNDNMWMFSACGVAWNKKKSQQVEQSVFLT